MVSVTNINHPQVRFLNRKDFEEIKSKANRLPFGEYRNIKEKIVCVLFDRDGNPSGQTIELGEWKHPGSLETMKTLKRDLDSLISHVENADYENDYLMNENKRLKELLDEKGLQYN